MKKLRIYNNKGVLGINVEVPYKTVAGTEEYISIYISEDGINVPATGTLGANGIKALEQALAVAKVIYDKGLEIVN